MVEPNELVRRSDPDPSHQAARKAARRMPVLKKWAEDCVREMPDCTARELALAYCRTDPRKIGRLLPYLERDGVIERKKARICRVSKHLAATWKLREKGQG